MGILDLPPPEIEKRIHPRAMEHLRKFVADVRLEVLLEELTSDDLNRHLKDDEKPEFQRNMNQITDGLRTCMDIEDADSLDIDGKLWLFELHTIMPMFNIKRLLKKVCRRKLEKERREAEEAREKKRREEEQERQRAVKAEEERKRQAAKAAEERKRKQEEEQWHVAYQALNVPRADAKRYLKPEEQDRFIKSIDGAVRAYIDKKESYNQDTRAYDYLFYCQLIKGKKEEERQKLAATVNYRLFSDSLDKQINGLRARLHIKKQSLSKYFSKDSRYIGQKFYSLLSSNDKDELFDMVKPMVKEKLDELLSGDLSEFTSWKHTQYYRLLPTVDYILDGVPCLSFWFDTEIVAEVEIRLKPSQKKFGYYLFDLPVIHKGNYSVELQEPKFLGYHYIHFATSMLPTRFWQTIPLSLIKSLDDSEGKPNGITIIEASESESTYRIKNFEREVVIPKAFSDFLKAVRGLDGLKRIGSMPQEIVSILQREVPELWSARMKETSESAQSMAWSKEDFISKMASKYYSRKDSEILLKHTPEGLSLDGAVKWALSHYREIIAQNPSSE